MLEQCSYFSNSRFPLCDRGLLVHWKRPVLCIGSLEKSEQQLMSEKRRTDERNTLFICLFVCLFVYFRVTFLYVIQRPCYALKMHSH